MKPSMILAGVLGAVVGFGAVIFIASPSSAESTTQAVVTQVGQCAGRSPKCAFAAKDSNGQEYWFTNGSPKTVGQPVTIEFFTSRGERRMRVKD